MPFNPKIHHRRSIRLKGYDYSQAGLYFVTICCEDGLWRFGKIENGKMILNDFGQIALQEWQKLPERYPNIILDAFQIMPNHVHFIFEIVGATLAVAQNDVAAVAQNNVAIVRDDAVTDVGATLAVAQNENTVAQNENVTANFNRATARVAPTDVPAKITVGNIIGAYKSLVANRCLELCKQRSDSLGKLWQRNYHEHIIRDRNVHAQIAEYIENNPAKWETDCYHTT